MTDRRRKARWGTALGFVIGILVLSDHAMGTDRDASALPGSPVESSAPAAGHAIASLRYYLVVNGSDPDFRSLGATVESAWKDRRLVTLPAAAVDELAANAAVAYMRLVAQPQDGASVEGPSPFIDEQMKAVVAAPEGSGQWTTGTYQYDGAGNIKGIGPDSYGRAQSYTYDGVSRVTYGTAHTKDNVYGEQYQYDAYGNMTWKSTGPSIATDPATNRLTGVTYDEAGHITQYGAANYEWDGGGMMKERWGDGPRTRYVYTPDDERIGTLRVDAGWWTWTVRDFGGKVIREYESPSSGESWLWVEDYAHGAGRLLASEREPSEGGRRHYHLDHLGTTRMVTSGETATLGTRLSEHVYYPFGTESTLLVQEPNGRQTRLKYTGHERDYVGDETGENTNVLDYMHARYYNPNLGRFLSTDPGKDWDPRVPQSWNLYSYVRNNPIVLTDPTGMNVFKRIWDAVVDYFAPQVAENDRARQAQQLADDPTTGVTQAEANSQKATTYREGLKQGVSTTGAELTSGAVQAAIFIGGQKAVEVAGVRFTEFYYSKLLTTGRANAAGVAGSILRAGAVEFEPLAVSVARREGQGFLLQRATVGGKLWEMVYNPVTREVYHILPVKDASKVITQWR